MKNIEFLKQNLIAHRGVHYRYKENTIPSFREAIIKNYIIELDIHITTDNKVIVFHDNNLKRLTGINKFIKDLTYKEIKKIIDIPLLEEVLELVKGKVPIIIELKFDTKLGRLENNVIKILDKYKGKFAIQSFNPLTILIFKLKRKNYIRGYLINSITKKNIFIERLLKSKFLNKIIKPDYLGINKNYLDHNKIKKLRKKYLVFAYTIEFKDELNKFKDYADNFICNINYDF